MYGTQLCPLSGLSFTGNQTVVSETFGVDMRQLWKGGVRGAKIGTGEVEKRAREHSERNKKTLKRSPLTENKVLLFFLFLSSQDIEGAREVRMGDR